MKIGAKEATESVASTEEYSRADYFNDSYNSRDLNPTEPMDHGCGSRRE
jgi:hypothetical protein